jgi:CRP-like cAMP-binding protein
MRLPLAVQDCAAAQLARKYVGSIPFSEDEQAALRELTSSVRAVRRREDILTEGKKYRALFLVSEGVLMRYRILRDGRRQILNLVIPGDFAGVPGCLFENALYSIKALTDAVLSTIPIDRLFALWETRPSLAAKIFWSFSSEAAVYAEHLIIVGRRSALERIAHFLLELLARLQAVGLADESSYYIPLSQELIGDMLGLSLPYVNRVLRQLAEEGLVTIKDHKVTILDVEALASLADFEPGYLKPLAISEFLERAQ